MPDDGLPAACHTGGRTTAGDSPLRRPPMRDLVLLILAFTCFALAAAGATARRINLIALGAAFAILVPLLDAWSSL